MGYFAGSKGWKFWIPSTNTFSKSTHARWLTENAAEDATRAASRSAPIPDAPSDISKLLNTVECAETALLEALAVTYDLSDTKTTTSIREQDRLVEQIVVLSSGLSQKLPRTYNAAMKGDE